MEPQTPLKSRTDEQTAMFWLLSGVVAITATLELIEGKDMMKAMSGYSLLVAFVLTAMSGGELTKLRKGFVYAFGVLSVVLTVARHFAR